MSLSCSKAFLMIVNLIFFILGIAIMVVGFLLLFREKLIGTLYDVVKNPLAELVIEGVNGSSLSSVLRYIAIICIVLGALVVIISSFGCCGALCESRTALVVYAIAIAVVFALEIAAVAILFHQKSEIETNIKDQMNKTLYNDYTNNPENPKDVTWNALFLEFECCGVNEYWDVRKVKNYIEGSYNFTTPVFCCKEVTFDFPQIKAPPNDTSFQCALYPKPENSNYQTGCYKAIKSKVISYQLAFIIVGIFGLITKFLCFLAASCLCCQTKSDISFKRKFHRVKYVKVTT